MVSILGQFNAMTHRSQKGCLTSYIPFHLFCENIVHLDISMDLTTVLMTGATGGAEHAHFSRTPDITTDFTVVYECIYQSGRNFTEFYPVQVWIRQTILGMAVLLQVVQVG